MVKVRVHPRIEVTKWSLYHNSSLSTKTLILDDVELNFPKQATVHEISQSSWQYIQKCETTCLHLMADKNLVDYGIQKDVNLVTIRRLFVVEGELH
ncbi:unnamed product [Ostreococcus tauri]|uniref:Unnamed product n=1 Tax=Ostreococcus tauri TaxID=70448 RepID=A0A090N4L5_OSTTA|nr:unnamed product [Ostreococcus tauri]CEG00920.1 unnamed product [Ostreococcus tauri]|eukprot:XP_022840670.1 unnamed product [Ostreococcus tauri]